MKRREEEERLKRLEDQEKVGNILFYFYIGIPQHYFYRSAPFAPEKTGKYRGFSSYQSLLDQSIALVTLQVKSAMTIESMPEGDDVKKFEVEHVTKVYEVRVVVLCYTIIWYTRHLVCMIYRSLYDVNILIYVDRVFKIWDVWYSRFYFIYLIHIFIFREPACRIICQAVYTEL